MLPVIYPKPAEKTAVFMAFYLTVTELIPHLGNWYCFYRNFE
jgi:hypothetical protein